MVRKLALVFLVIILGILNWSIYTKEKHLTDGRIIFLELAPVDPRSLMQGDYMALRFNLANDIDEAFPQKNEQHFRNSVDASDGYVVVSLDDRNIVTFKFLYKDQALSRNEILLRYRIRNGSVKFATNAFFFQEGHSKYYESAQYGQFRIDDSGELLLVAMHDKELNKLGPVEK